MGYCEKCNHFYASVCYNDVLDYLLDHLKKCHKGKDRFFIVRITPKDYQDYLANKDNPAFWKAWNNIKKPEIIAQTLV